MFYKQTVLHNLHDLPLTPTLQTEHLMMIDLQLVHLASRWVCEQKSHFNSTSERDRPSALKKRERVKLAVLIE